jgi:hypothetical protein
MAAVIGRTAYHDGDAKRQSRAQEIGVESAKKFLASRDHFANRPDCAS